MDRAQLEKVINASGLDGDFAIAAIAELGKILSEISMLPDEAQEHVVKNLAPFACSVPGVEKIAETGKILPGLVNSLSAHDQPVMVLYLVMHAPVEKIAPIGEGLPEIAKLPAGYRARAIEKLAKLADVEKIGLAISNIVACGSDLNLDRIELAIAAANQGVEIRLPQVSPPKTEIMVTLPGVEPSL